jgi:hypothetical protein
MGSKDSPNNKKQEKEIATGHQPFLPRILIAGDLIEIHIEI